jgi:hypothetical protein
VIAFLPAAKPECSGHYRLLISGSLLQRPNLLSLKQYVVQVDSLESDATIVPPAVIRDQKGGR